MRDHGSAAVEERRTGSDVLSPSEKLMCEWEARHDVAARARQVDPAHALSRYLSRTHIEEERRHRQDSARRSGRPPDRRARRAGDFAVQHPLLATWLRWGEERR